MEAHRESWLFSGGQSMRYQVIRGTLDEPKQFVTRVERSIDWRPDCENAADLDEDEEPEEKEGDKASTSVAPAPP